MVFHRSAVCLANCNDSVGFAGALNRRLIFGQAGRCRRGMDLWAISRKSDVRADRIARRRPGYLQRIDGFATDGSLRNPMAVVVPPSLRPSLRKGGASDGPKQSRSRGKQRVVTHLWGRQMLCPHEDSAVTMGHRATQSRRTAGRSKKRPLRPNGQAARLAQKRAKPPGNRNAVV